MVLDPRYLDQGVLSRARRAYRGQGSIRLDGLLQPSVFAALLRRIEAARFKERFDPMSHLYLSARVKEAGSFIKGPYFSGLVRAVTGRAVRSLEVRRLDPGCYTLLSRDRPGAGFIFSFSDAGRFGGQRVFTGKDPLTFLPKANSLAIVERPKGSMSYDKYVRKAQRSPIYEIVGSLE